MKLKKYIADLKKEFKNYNLSTFIKDLLAGITLAAVALPLALAFGVSSGAGAIAGLISAVFAGLIMGTLSGASYQVSGPTGAMSAILFGLYAMYGFESVFITGFLAGILLLICSLFKVGRIVSFIPNSVMCGFTSGVAIIIATGQINNFFGSYSEGATSVEQFTYYIEHGFSVHIPTLMIGLLVVFIMFAWPKKWKLVPSSLIALIVALIINMLFDLDVAQVGDIPATLIADDRLRLLSINAAQIKVLIIPAISIASLVMIETLLCGASGGKMKDEKMNADRELFAQGIGNIIIPMFGGIPATAVIARTSVAIKSGAQTRVVSIVHSLVLIASMFLLSPFISKIPMASLAGVLMVTSIRMNAWKDINHMFSKKLKTSISQFLITMVATVVFDLTVAIILGVFLSMLLFVLRHSELHIVVSKVDTTRIGVPLQHHHEDTSILYVSGPLFFGTQEKLFEIVEHECQNNSSVIISMRGVPSIDESGVEELASIYQLGKSNNCEIYLCGLQEEIYKQLERHELLEVYDLTICWDAIAAIQLIDSQYDK